MGPPASSRAGDTDEQGPALRSAAVKRPSQRIALLFAGLALVSGACASGGGSDVDLSSDPELQTGRDVYNANCARCHGPEGGGGVGIKINDGLMEIRFPDIEDQIALITSGFGGMPAWEGTLTPEEIRAVARYEREVL
jgi:mono/diheme cytochrome c family protein